MTEDGAARCRRRRRGCSSTARRARSRACRSAAGRSALEAANRALGLALSADEIDYLLASFAPPRTRPDRRRADDVRAGQLRALPPQDLQRRTGSSTASRSAQSLFAMIRNTHARNPAGVLSAYRDNAAVIEGARGARFFPDPASGVYRASREPIDILMKVETHNHPTAISPFPGAATGSGGEIRDEGATGRGAKPKAGLTGFSRLEPAHSRLSRSPGSATFGTPARIASALDIMIDGPIGAASFNNEFGRPTICGYFRTFEQQAPGDPPQRRARLSQADHDRRRPRQRAPHARGESRGAGRRAARRARRPGHADRPGRRCRLLGRQRQLERGSGFRLGAARQSPRCSAAPRK